MTKNSIRITTGFFSVAILLGAWFWVLYNEEHRRIAKAAEAKQAYLEELKSIDSERKAYFDSVAANRKQQAETMAAAKAAYEALLKSQDAKVQAQTTTTTQVVNKPVIKKETVKVAKPKSTRKSKTS